VTVSKFKDQGCLICGKNPDNYKGDREFICSRCVIARVNFVAMLERKIKMEIRTTRDFYEAHRLWESKNRGQEESLAKKLIEMRKLKGWTQEALGVFFGISQNYLSKMENGCKPLNQKALEFIEQNKIILTNG